MKANKKEETIIALSTSQGTSGIGIIRTSGSKSKMIAIKILGKIPEPRVAELLDFFDSANSIIDKGLAIFFPKPSSFTGEDVLELQGHGNPIILDTVIQTIVRATGIRIASPGEFLKRAFLNRKIDLTQAEAISDIITTTSLRTAKSAMKAMLGRFSEEVNNIKALITKARINIESNLCFTEEDNISKRKANKLINKALLETKRLYNKTKATNKLPIGKTIVIAGAPNTGKSSIFNAITESDTAIVTELAGTTRDVLYKSISISGLSLNIVDTAGMHKTKDMLEKIGIKRTWGEVKKADHILLVRTNLTKEDRIPNILTRYFSGKGITIIINKIDLTKEKAEIIPIESSYNIVKLSAKTGEGIDLLKKHLKSILAPEEPIEANFIVKKRHINILKTTIRYLIKASKVHIETINTHIAEEVGLAEKELAKIGGEANSGYMLNEGILNGIFSSLCIGK
ncbi:tRNA uridine-5-carboxymethylaminomethyl(34) synthesis GTPase MnmE [Candidatus Tremblaya phenacola]|uniref:tRNA uridine-5-carboxymethylaminomethyl(34) synthesis GTPase MnmE n=1 Tax=Candidatus Tremblayella phenacoccinincola TaxID=1010676 RepID=UPI001330267C|nr:tRNA uridine-5-carboxymethylaminomethyl(34) synthesis GTPase MnmE [Candidatus Tremblaya phenacola]KAH0998172.1 tRNA-5-carboxymethylaminomethyl-2-thiouridine(34) synthesis protein MnmE [Candidatus Tremblaya phenacola]